MKNENILLTPKLRIKAGFRKIKKNPYLLFLLIIEIAIFISLMFFKRDVFNRFPVLPVVVLATIAVFGTIYLLGVPLCFRTVSNGLEKAGLKNHAGETPMLLTVERDPENNRISVYEFYAAGIPLSEWEDKRTELEAALNINIINYIPKEGVKNMCMTCVKAKGAIPERIDWSDSLLSKTNKVLIFGEGAAGPVEIDISKIPHCLIGGSTGSGKTVLVKCIAYQAIQIGMKVLLCDFKGVDFTSSKWDSPSCKKVLSVEDLTAELHNAIEMLEYRRGCLQITSSVNIDEFNKKQDEYSKMCRYLIVIDEIAEVLDTTGATKEQKERIAEIVSLLSTIARQGRAFGIHLLLGTQRPDANILPGQIKNNIDCRICGKADNVLSQIILDSTAATEIPKTSQGRFIMSDGTLFQAYYFAEGGGKND